MNQQTEGKRSEGPELYLISAVDGPFQGPLDFVLAVNSRQALRIWGLANPAAKGIVTATFMRGSAYRQVKGKCERVTILETPITKIAEAGDDAPILSGVYA